jgi:hypothetical protein
MEQPAMGSNVKQMIRKHPVAVGCVIATLVVLILILAFALFHYKDKCEGAAEGFGYGYGHGYSLYPFGHPRHRRGHGHGGYRHGHGGHRHYGYDGFASGAAGPCAPGEVPVTYTEADGTTVTYCRSTSAMPGPPSVCGAGWDPAAQAEAEALATVGGLQPDAVYGERRLQRAVGGAFDSSLGLSDDQLTTLMHQGETP